MADIDIDKLRRLLPELLDRLECETASVDSVWKALGIATYEQARPYSVSEHVARLKDRLGQYARALRDAKRELEYIQQSPEMMGHNDIAHLCDAIEIIDKSLEQTDG